MIKLLVVDDSALMRRLLGDIFKAQGDFQVSFARDGLEALEQIGAIGPDVVTLDVQMPLMDGLACLDRIMVEHPCPVVMVSSLTEAGADVTLDAMALGAVDFVAKPGGAMSLAIDDLAPILVEKVRAASKARLSRALRLTERIRLQAGHGTDVTRTSSPRARHSSATTASLLSRAEGFPDGLVLVGTSTGGPPALDALLSPLRADFPWPILVAQHMPALFTGPLARRLDKLCALTVVEVTQPMSLHPGYVYVGKGDADIVVSKRPGGIVAMPAPPMAEHRWHPSVERLVTSAMLHVKPAKLVGILMTGMGNDGAAAMTRLRAEGGRTIAEAQETAVVWGMPGELVKAGGAQVVAPLDDIAPRLTEWLR